MSSLRWLGVGIASLAVLGGAVVPLAAGDAESWSLVGTLSLRGATIVDPPPEERRDSHASFLVEGEAARRLYEALRAPETDDLCEGEGGRIKRVGNLACARSGDGRRYECDFAIDLARGSLEVGRAC